MGTINRSSPFGSCHSVSDLHKIHYKPNPNPIHTKPISFSHNFKKIEAKRITMISTLRLPLLLVALALSAPTSLGASRGLRIAGGSTPHHSVVSHSFNDIQRKLNDGEGDAVEMEMNQVQKNETEAEDPTSNAIAIEDDPNIENETEPEANDKESDGNSKDEHEHEKDDKKHDSKDDGELSTRSSVIAPSIRKCETDESHDKVKFSCTASEEDSSSHIKDKVKYEVGATKGDFLKIKVEYSTKIEDVATDTKNETKTQYSIVYDRIIEYRKSASATADDDHYEWGVDEVVAEWSMDTWDELTAVETDGDLLKFSATDGVASFSFTITQTDSTDLTTNKMKIDFLLENYPWDASGDTFVALISHIETERKTKSKGGPEHGLKKDEISQVTIDFQEAVATAGFIPFGEYSWAETAEATSFTSSNGNGNVTDAVAASSRQADDNSTAADFVDIGSDGSTTAEPTTTTISVVASTAPYNPDLPYSEIAFSFVGAAQGADRIYWDPEAGVGYQSSSAPRALGWLAAVILTTTSLAAVFVL